MSIFIACDLVVPSGCYPELPISYHRISTFRAFVLEQYHRDYAEQDALHQEQTGEEEDHRVRFSRKADIPKTSIPNSLARLISASTPPPIPMPEICTTASDTSSHAIELPLY